MPNHWNLLASSSTSPSRAGWPLLDGRLYLAATASDELWVLDADTLRDIGTGGSWARAVCGGSQLRLSRYVLVANAGSGSITAINRFDTASKIVISLGGLRYPQQITTDPQYRRVLRLLPNLAKRIRHRGH